MQELEDRLMELITTYTSTSSLDEKLNAYGEILQLADDDYVGGCYVIGTCLLGEGPCGDGLIEINRTQAKSYLTRAVELGDPLAASFIEKHGL